MKEIVVLPTFQREAKILKLLKLLKQNELQ